MVIHNIGFFSYDEFSKMQMKEHDFLGGNNITEGYLNPVTTDNVCKNVIYRLLKHSNHVSPNSDVILMGIQQYIILIGYL